MTREILTQLSKLDFLKNYDGMKFDNSEWPSKRKKLK